MGCRGRSRRAFRVRLALALGVASAGAVALVAWLASPTSPPPPASPPVPPPFPAGDDRLRGLDATIGSQAAVERLAAGGVDEVRVQLAPRHVLACDARAVSAARDWSRYDRRMQLLATAGIDVVLTVIGWPAPCFGDTGADGDGDGSDDRFPGIPTANRAAADGFYREVVRRYHRTSGPDSYWARNGVQPDGRLDHLEIHNEPNLERFWTSGRKVDAARYTEYLCRSHRAIEEVDPAVRVISGGLSSSDWSAVRAGYDGTVDLGAGNSYVDAMYRAGAASCLDEFGYHPYTHWAGGGRGRQDPRGVGDELAELGREIATNDGERSIAATEWGWGTLTTQRGDIERGRVTATSLSETLTNRALVARRQASIIAGTLRDLESRADRLGLRRAHIFELVDRPDGNLPIRWYEHSGLFREDGVPKPSWGSVATAFGGAAGIGALALAGPAPHSARPGCRVVAATAARPQRAGLCSRRWE